MTDSLSPGFSDKAVLVTGGTGGVGLAVAEQMSRLGARVAVTGRVAERGEQALQRLRAIRPNAAFICCDSADYAGATKAVKEAAKELGGIDVLVSAGAQGTVSPMPFATMSAEQIQHGFTSRFLGRMFPVHAAIPEMQAKGGSIVLITTDAARHPTPGESIIGATGASIILMTKTLARELSRWSIRVNALALTLTSDTPSWDRIFGDDRSFENKLFSKALERFPQGRAPTSAEVARAAVFLASDDATQITGQTLSVNGGLSFGGW